MSSHDDHDPDAGARDLDAGARDPVVVREATDASPGLLDALHRLVPQLSSSAPPLTADHLDEIVRSASTVLFVAEQGGEVLGSLSLVLFRAPTGLRAWIEDVVVDDAARGLGVGASLVRHALERARDAGAQTVDLTSRPSREAANRLYVREGFVQRTTNVYRHSVQDDPTRGDTAPNEPGAVSGAG